ncbi:MAG: SDR family NAD(P)-dependent oxidoreductase [Albidovulum sp.]
MTRSFAGKTYWIIGASEGLGRALAHALKAAGAEVIISARNSARLESLSSELGGARAITLDVTNRQSVANAADQAGRIDGLIYSVGLYEPMTAADWQPEAAEDMCEANFTGAMRVLGQTVPAMIAQNRGHVVLIGSLAGYRGLPGAIGYGASKAALMHLAENLHAETRNTGVVVQLANPGFIRTRLTDKNAFAMPMIMSPEQAASRVMKHMQSAKFQCDFPRPFSWLFIVGRFLPSWVFYRMIGSK